MEENKVQIRNIQLIFRHSTTLLKVVVIILVVFSMAALTTLAWVQNSIAGQTAALRQEAAILEEENRNLKRKIENPGAVTVVEEIAQKELGLVRPGTVFIKPE